MGGLDGCLLRHDPTNMHAMRAIVHVLTRVFLLYTATVVGLPVLMVVVELELLFGEMELRLRYCAASSVIR